MRVLESPTLLSTLPYVATVLSLDEVLVARGYRIQQRRGRAACAAYESFGACGQAEHTGRGALTPNPQPIGSTSTAQNAWDWVPPCSRPNAPSSGASLCTFSVCHREVSGASCGGWLGRLGARSTRRVQYGDAAELAAQGERRGASFMRSRFGAHRRTRQTDVPSSG